MNDVESVSCGARGAAAIPPTAPGLGPRSPPPRARPASNPPYRYPVPATVPLEYSFREHDIPSVPGEYSVSGAYTQVGAYVRIARATPRLRTWTQRRGSGVCMKCMYAPCRVRVYTPHTGCVTTQVGVRSRERG